MSDQKITIRPGVEADVAVLTEMINRFNAEDDTVHHVFTEEQVREDGFGSDPAFKTLVADQEGQVCGYIMYLSAYDTIEGGRGLYMQDAYVSKSARSAGIGRKMLAALAQIGVETKAVSIAWGVFDGNRRGRQFYASIGASDAQARVMELYKDNMIKLAQEAE